MAVSSDLFKLEGIVLDDGTLRAGHEPLEAGGEKALAGGGQHAQQLLKGQEGGGQLELHLHAGKVAYVRDPGGEVVRIEPGPGHAAVVVVVQVPLDGPSVQYRGLHMNHVYISIVPVKPCRGSALVFTSMRIRIQGAKPMRIHADPDPGQILASQKVDF